MTTFRERSDNRKISCIGNNLVASLPSNLDASRISAFETQLLNQLSHQKRLRGVILDFSAVESTDPSDLRRLQEMLLAVKLLGRNVVFCGITPGLAALIVQAGIRLHHNAIGLDIDDALESIRHA
jgi:anti-anti-sigma regulatory factor